MSPIPVYLSRYNWQPGMDGSLFAWAKGEIVTFRGSTGNHQVRVDSDLMSHTDSPSGFVYECVFLDGSGRWALDPTKFEPCAESQSQIATGRVSLGLAP